MNMLKRSLALLLVLCMMFSVVPFNAFASESTDPTDTETVSEDAATPNEDDSNAPAGDQSAAEDPVADEPGAEDSAAADPVTEDPAAENPVTEDTVTADLVTTDPAANHYSAAETDTEDEIMTTALTLGTKPSDGTTTGEPFPQGTGESNSFRIPALVTLSDGTLVAAADARWNTTYDGGGLDTIVSRSADGGATWNYSFANYLGDNGNENNASSTAFIDPSLVVTADDTIYMLVDLYPYGVALNGGPETYPVTTKGFNDAGKLLLSGDNHSTYGYYLDGGKIYSSEGTEQTGYAVDAYFNITGNGYDTNLFFSDSPFKVVRTGFLYLTKSTDKGVTWSAPTLLNLKTDSERVCLVSPGRGLVTSNGTIIFPCYSFYADNVSTGAGLTQYTGFIYSTDSGATWNRSDNFTGASWSSESAVVELKNGNLRFFYRNGSSVLCYVDYDMANKAWGSANTTSISTNSNCQISAITYSKTISDQQVILVSCPTGPNEAGSNLSGASYRLNGKIFAFTVNSDGTNMTSRGSISVTSNDNQFMYSCMTELADGTVGILYEDCESAWGTGSNCYYTMSYAEYDLASEMGLTFDSASSGESTEPEGDVTITEGATLVTAEKVENVTALADKTYVAYDITVADTAVTSATVVIKLNGAFADDAKLVAHYIDETGAIAETIEGTYDITADTFTFVATHFSTYAIAEDDVEITGEDTVTSNGQSGTAYVLDTDGIDTDTTYLIVNTGSDGTGYALTNNSGTIGSTEVAISNGAISVSDDSNIAWTFSGSTSGKVTNNGYYLVPWRNGVYADTIYSGYTLSFSNSGNGAYKVNYYNSCYLTYNNGWTGNTTSSNTVYLYALKNVESWTVNAALQESRIAAYTVANNNYTTESWTAYQNALTAANTKLAEVKAATYASETAANTALTELTAAVDALEAAKNALVKGVNINVYYQTNGATVKIETLTVASDATSATLPTVIVGVDGNIYAVTDNILQLTSGTSSYTVAVTELEGTPITIVENEPEEISVTLGNGQYVEWASADSSYVGVAGKYDADAAAYTNIGVMIGHNVTDKPVVVTGTVYNADGTMAGAHKWLVSVTAANASTNTTVKYIYLNIVRIQNCTIYYAINGGELVEITDDMLEGPTTDDNGTYYKLKVPLYDQKYTGGFHIAFFAKPDDGYALTKMSASGANNAGQYYVLSNGDNPDGTDSSAWPFVDGYDWDSYTSAEGYKTSIFQHDGTRYHGLTWGLAEGNFTVAQLKMMYSNALALGCDGVLVFTKNNNGTTYNTTNENNLVTDLEFVAQKLPEMVKEIKSITYTNADGSTTTKDYTTGMDIGIGCTINYVIKLYAPLTVSDYGDITYSNIKLVDELTDESWATAANQTVSSANTTELTIADRVSKVSSFDYVNAAGQTVTYNREAACYEYDTSLTLSAHNFLTVVKDGLITNTADMTYDYQSYYSVGSSASSSNAVADVVVEVPEYVIDFGAPVVIDLTNDPLVEGDKITKAVATYGTTEITADRKLTYTPNKVLQGTDFITLTFEEDQTKAIVGYGVRIYPATTVYYEEGFISTWSGSWIDKGNQNATTQDSEELGKKKNAYGYQGGNPAYAGNGADATTKSMGAYGSFTFTGTGIEIYANCTPDTGYVSVEIKNAAGATQKVYMVDTIAKGGTSDATKPQTNNSFSGIPIVAIYDLTHGTYTVTLRKIMEEEPINIDGFRVINTVKDSTVFSSDWEDNPEFYQLRDYVLKAMNVDNVKNSQYGSIDEMVDQVYAGISTDTEAPSAAILANGTYNADVQDLLDNGPKNEVYLYANQTLVFNVKTSRALQIGLKAPQGETSYSIAYAVENTTTSTTVKNNELLSSSVDMFYALNNATGTERTYTITITNNGAKILSVTDLKICDDPNAAFVPLTEYDIKYALTGEYDLDEDNTDTETPGENDPETSTPDKDEPETPAPDKDEPETSIPGENKPGVNKPEENKPETSTPDKDESEETAPEKVPMYRLYNPYTQEHLLTASEAEKDQLLSIGWKLDGIAWNSPKSGKPVYRLYNPFDDWHTYTMSQEEIDTLVPLGWQVDGAVCFSVPAKAVKPIYRLFNPYEQTNYHLLTASVEESEYLVNLGWKMEGVAWYAMAD